MGVGPEEPGGPQAGARSRPACPPNLTEASSLTLEVLCHEPRIP